jgi:nicotinate-nucleotide adenylyltransferase
LDYNERVKMVKMAIKGRILFKVSEVEALLPVPSYTINTLDYLKKKHPEHQFALIVGSDSMASFDKWKDYKRILNDYTIYVYKRGGKKGKLKSENIICLDSPLIDISSTKIRELIALDKPIKDYLPRPVYKHITSKKLYL